MCEEMLGAEGANLTKLLLGGFDALHKRMEKLAADVVDDGWSDAARAAVNLLDDLGALFSHLHNGVKRGDGPGGGCRRPRHATAARRAPRGHDGDGATREAGRHAEGARPEHRPTPNPDRPRTEGRPGECDHLDA